MMETVTVRKQPDGVTRVDMEDYFDDAEVENLYHWIDRIPLSRPKKNIGKDFSDGVLVAEVLKHYFPKMIELHNYSPASSTKQKMENWYLLNRRALRKLDLDLSDDVIRALANCKPKVVEKVLMLLRLQIDKWLEKQEQHHYLRSSAPVHTGAGRTSPGRQVVKLDQPRSPVSQPMSPRRYARGDIPHSHPDRSHLVQATYTPRTPPDYRTYMKPSHRPGSYNAMQPYIVPVHDNVPLILLEEKAAECQAKEETIKILNAKLGRFEHLLHLKDVRLEDLNNQIIEAQTLQAQDKFDKKKRRGLPST